MYCLFDLQVCGGGPSLSLWHLRSLTATTVFDTPGSCQQCVMFYEDCVRLIFGFKQVLFTHYAEIWFMQCNGKNILLPQFTLQVESIFLREPITVHASYIGEFIAMTMGHSDSLKL